MILFVDGVDGSGKTTLIDGVRDELAARGAPVVLAPALWTFLTPLAGPADFAGWVLRTSGVGIANQLLVAMCRRLDDLRTDIAYNVVKADTLVLADRGPKTVLCSAIAHASTGSTMLSKASTAAPRLADSIVALEGSVTCLAASADVVAVELVHGTPELVLSRLVPNEEVSPSYEGYLRAFADQMTTTAQWPGIPSLALPASGDAAWNVASVITWVACNSLAAARLRRLTSSHGAGSTGGEPL